MDCVLHYKGSCLAYRKTGQGSNAILLFHGFGQHHLAFHALTDLLGSHYTLFAFDLFFHGQSKWNQGEQPLEKTTWFEIIDQFLQENNLKRFSVLGFSIGGKFAFATVEFFSDRIDHLVLLAPDGIKTSFWYSLATYPILLRRFFRSMILHPGRLYKIVSIMRNLRLVDKGVLRFAEHQMSTQEKRERVYYSWVVFRHLTFDMKKMATLIVDQQIQLTLIVGQHDKIIMVNNMNRLLRYLNGVTPHVIDAGHNHTIEASLPLLHTILLEEFI